MKFIIVAALTAVTLLAIACTGANSPKQTADFKSIANSEKATNDNEISVNANNSSYYLADSAGTQNDKQQQKQPAVTSAPPANPDWDKKIIKNASLNLEVKDYYAYYTSLREKIRGFGGYIAQEEQSLSDYKSENTLTIKVPVDQFDNAVAALSAGVVRVNEKKISSQDVTAEFVDMRSRMEAKRAVRLRYIDLLKQAKNMEEILNVQGEINGIQEEIEAAAGRVEFLGHSSAFSTISLTYFHIINPTAKTHDGSPSFGTKLVQSFKSGGNWILDLMLGLVTIWPLFLLGFVALIIYRRSKNPKVEKKPG
jgi:hypothetical protein